MIVRAIIVALLLPSLCLGGGLSNRVVVLNGQIVTQFAVPVAVPQTTVTVAPLSIVQYGTQSTLYPQTDAKRLADELAEIKSMLAEGIGNGSIKGLSLPTQIKSSCVACHSGATPKGGLDLSDLTKLDNATRLKAIARVTSDDAKVAMPPTASNQYKSLTAEQRGKLLQELSTVPTLSVGPPADETIK